MAHEEDRREIAGQPGRHIERLGLAEDEVGARIEQLGNDVAHGAVTVVHQHFGGTALESAGDGGVDFFGHQPAPAHIPHCPAAPAGETTPATHLNVGGDVNLHVLEPSCPVAQPASTSAREGRMWPSRPRVFGAARSAFSTASCVASAAARNGRSMRFSFSTTRCRRSAVS